AGNEQSLLRPGLGIAAKARHRNSAHRRVECRSLHQGRGGGDRPRGLGGLRNCRRHRRRRVQHLHLLLQQRRQRGGGGGPPPTAVRRGRNRTGRRSFLAFSFGRGRKGRLDRGGGGSGMGGVHEQRSG